MIFGRNTAVGHALEAKLAPLDGVSTSDRFIAQNWRCDSRVSEPREQRVVGYVVGVPGDAPLQKCYGRYHRDCICSGSPVEYLHTCNDCNRVPGMSRDNLLARVVCLNHLLRDVQNELPETRAIAPGGLDAWLDQRIASAKQAGYAHLGNLISTVFQAWNNWTERDQRPVWASFWADVRPVLDPSPWADRLRDTLGLGRLGANKWLIVLRYRVRDARGRVIRPTSLEAEWQPWHFPSPPSEPTGFSMDLRPGSRGACCPEVIHAPIVLQIEHWTGDLDRTSTSPGELQIGDLRRRHYDRLRARFRDSVVKWLPAPP